MRRASDRVINAALLTISPLSLKHLARQRSLWHGALVSQHPQSFDVCFALLGQSGISAIAAESSCADAIAVPTGASVTPTAISNASRKRCKTKATSGVTILGIGLTGQVTPVSKTVQFCVSDCKLVKNARRCPPHRPSINGR